MEEDFGEKGVSEREGGDVEVARAVELEFGEVARGERRECEVRSEVVDERAKRDSQSEQEDRSVAYLIASSSYYGIVRRDGEKLEADDGGSRAQSEERS